jgi:hemoglobin
MSIYGRLGQQQGIRTAVDEFYERVLSDPQMMSYFDGVDMRRLRAHQVALLAQVTGGPAGYSGRGLTAAHEHLGITPHDFDRVVGHLAATLADLGVQPDDFAEVGAALAEHRDEIVTPSSAAS